MHTIAHLSTNSPPHLVPCPTKVNQIQCLKAKLLQDVKAVKTQMNKLDPDPKSNDPIVTRKEIVGKNINNSETKFFSDEPVLSDFQQGKGEIENKI